MELAIYWIGLLAVAVSACSGVVEAERKEIDLVGATFVALATALGGGTVRDLLLSRQVFWVADQTYLLTALVSGLAIFFVIRKRHVSARWFLVPDAVGLALFSVVGTQAALQLNAPWLVATAMGVITGVVGGVLRDILCNEVPLIMRPGELYASAAAAGNLLLIALLELGVAPLWSSTAGLVCILLLRLSAMRYHLTLPALPPRKDS